MKMPNTCIFMCSLDNRLVLYDIIYDINPQINLVFISSDLWEACSFTPQIVSISRESALLKSNVLSCGSIQRGNIKVSVTNFNSTGNLKKNFEKIKKKNKHNVLLCLF